jgi:hypothetical protein
MSRTIKGQYCSPGSEGKAGMETCYTKGQLVDMINSYNRSYAGDKLSVNGTKNQLWDRLEKVMVSECITGGNRVGKNAGGLAQRPSEKCCSDEWCWMKKLGKDYQNDIKSAPFRPDKPEGQYAWLSTRDIYNVLKQYEVLYSDFIAMGPVAIDFCSMTANQVCRININRLRRSGIKRVGIVFNTDPSHEQGKHWISMFLDMTSNRQSDWTIEYFDSYGRAPIAPEISKLIEVLQGQNPYFQLKLNCSSDICNYSKQHQKGNSECGVYAINFIAQRLAGKSYDNLVIENIQEDVIMNRLRDYYFRGS